MAKKIILVLVVALGRCALAFAQGNLEIETGPATIEVSGSSELPKSSAIYYYPNGQLYYIARLSADRTQTIIDEVRDSTGAVLARRGKGVFIQYDQEFKRVVGIGRILNGLKDGKWVGNLADSASYTCTYNNGVLSSGISREKSGITHRFKTESTMPQYAGYRANLDGFLRKNIDLFAPEFKKSGMVAYGILNFTIEKDGTLSNIRLLRGVDPRIDTAILKAMQLSSPWVPEYQYGVPMRVQYQLSVHIFPRPNNVSPFNWQIYTGRRYDPTTGKYFHGILEAE